MTKTDLIAQVAANTEMSKKSAELAVNAALSAQSARASTPAPVSPSPSLLPRALSLSRARL